ncbi:hypothetical protein [Cupriavidus campinensis]|uniref:hypothetical protein n=1 Tax=Cupriavidus campinensis TaxID=151783 RepID=UPI0024E23111|nr:hypothetical protein [Cupriavidus campinensis]
MKFLQRMREPSTWAGFAGIAIAMGANPDKVNVTAQAVAGVLAAIAVFLPEKGQGK